METTMHASGHGAKPHSGNALVDFLVYYAEGDAPLWKAFWLWGVVLSWILFAAFATAINSVGISWLLFAVATIVMIPYTAWILVAVWRCAFNVRNDLWGYLARFLTVVWSLNIGIAAGLLVSELALS